MQVIIVVTVAMNIGLKNNSDNDIDEEALQRKIFLV
jgi:hypothetical protein